MTNILVTGGAGYIGSHTVVELSSAGFTPIIVDNFSNSDVQSIRNIEELTGKKIQFYDSDYRDSTAITSIIKRDNISGAIHFAAYKYVGESVEQPLKYYDNNVSGFVALQQTLAKTNINNFIFSSSAAVYGNPPTDIVTEDTTPSPESPYGWSKYMDEIILRDFCTSSNDFRGTALRYFNVVGSHPSAIIGESPKLPPQNLLPLVVKAASGQIKILTVHGNDYPTPDGTCLRDYIHVVDLAKAHVAALQRSIKYKKGSFYEVYNISTGRPTSVLEIINTFETENKVKVPYAIGARRAGDSIAYYSTAEKARKELGWRAQLDTKDAVRDAWRWQLANE